MNHKDLRLKQSKAVVNKKLNPSYIMYNICSIKMEMKIAINNEKKRGGEEVCHALKLKPII